MTSITCYDGVGCIGGNKILLEDGESRLFFDFGRNFGAEALYYEEFIKPKNAAGLYEHVQMGFLPPFRDLYRDDMISGLCDPWLGIDAGEIGEVGGVLVSHAHVDHIGSIHHLRPDIPIYASPMTAAVSRALQDTGKSASDAEYCYYVCRTEKEGGELATPHWKAHPYLGRKYYLTGDSQTPEFCQMWDHSPGARELDALACEPALACAGLNIRSFPVDHSVYGATAWAVETSAGWVVYSGDVRLHGTYADYTKRFAEEAAKLQPVALIIEGTRIESESDHTEATVKDACLDVVRECTGFVVADFGPRNVERLISFLDIARETGRELAILPKDAYLIEAMGRAGGTQTVPPVDSPGIRIYCEYSGGGSKWQDQILSSYPHLCITPEQLSANQDRFICCLSFWDVNELPYIRPVPGSIWISSNCEAFNEEMQIDERRLRNWLDRFGLRFVGGDTGHNSPFHVSGHASGSDLMEIVRTIRPKNLIPVHTERPDIYVARVGDVCNVCIPEKGRETTL